MNKKYNISYSIPFVTRRNTSIPKKLKRRQHMTFIMTSSNDDKSDICQLIFIKTYSIFSIQYMYRISCKMDKHFLRCSMFFHRGPTSPPPAALRFSKKNSPGRVESNFVFYSIMGQKTKAGCLNFSYYWLNLNFNF